MNNIGNSFRRSLIKRQEAIDRFKTRRNDFLIAKDQITKDLEEAREIWENTLKQLPDQEFKY